jgi:hypothetical protein
MFVKELAEGISKYPLTAVSDHTCYNFLTIKIPSRVEASVILRFLLDLRHMNVHANEATGISYPTTMTSFVAASQRFQTAIIGDFGDHMLHQAVSDEIELEQSTSGENVECQFEEGSDNIIRVTPSSPKVTEASSVQVGLSHHDKV